MLDRAITLPRKCFISHAYLDATARDRLIGLLPTGVTPFVFPPITVGPQDFVSDPLIDAVLDCDGLIYLRGGASDSSFWVALERDYALRAGKKVYAFDATNLELTQDTQAPLDLAAFASYHHHDAQRVLEIADHLNQSRHFDMWLDAQQLESGSDWAHETSASLSDRLARGGYAVVFWSLAASESRFVQTEIERAAQSHSGGSDRVMFALLEPCPIPECWMRLGAPCVQLYGGPERSPTQRLDDLVVRLYWLIHRKTKVADVVHVP